MKTKTTFPEKWADDLAFEDYFVADHFVSPEAVNQMVDWIKWQREEGNLRKAGIGAHDQFLVDKNIRGDYIKWVDPADTHPSVKEYIAKITELISFINESCFLALKDHEIHLTCYPVGSFYERHIDQFKQQDTRKLSFLLYLNEDWQPEDGGALRIYFKDGRESVDIYPEASRFICFRSDKLEHEVLVCNRERISLTGWMLDQIQFDGLGFLP